jgi:hypothetical protein
MRHTTLGSNNTAIAEGLIEELKVGLLEQRLGGTLGVGRVGDNHVECVLILGQELKAIANVDLDLGVVEANSHIGKILLGEANDSLYQGSASRASLVRSCGSHVPHQCRRG